VHAVPGLALAIALLVATASCGTKGCDLIGQESGVGLQVPNSEWNIVELCVDDTCVTGRPRDPGVVVAVDDEPGEHRYRFSVLAPSGATVQDEGRLRTEEYRVNGPGCPPVTANATIAISDSGDVSVTHP
jgi:hypothetical protein